MSAPRSRPPRPAPPARLAEEVLEDVRHEVGEVGVEARPAGAAIGEGRVAEAVVGGALLAVGEDLVGLVDFLELDLGVLVAGIAVRVALHRELAEGGLQLRLAGGLADAQDLVVVALRHDHACIDCGIGAAMKVRSRSGPAARSTHWMNRAESTKASSRGVAPGSISARPDWAISWLQPFSMTHIPLAEREASRHELPGLERGCRRFRGNEQRRRLPRGDVAATGARRRQGRRPEGDRLDRDRRARRGAEQIALDALEVFAHSQAPHFGSHP